MRRNYELRDKNNCENERKNHMPTRYGSENMLSKKRKKMHHGNTSLLLSIERFKRPFLIVLFAGTIFFAI